MNLPKYDELHVVSDLHMGGAPGFQILGETARLARFVRWVRDQRPDGQVGLVLNGDIVDTLAEDVAGYIATDTAAATIERIVDRDPAFSPIWDALADFVRTKNRTLVLVIGNHDLELALPPVHRLLMSRLAGEDLAARARVEWSTFGAGHACLVGDTRVFCIHGNEVDAWNYVRYEDLTKLARRLNAGRVVGADEWEPNAGTKMVKDVMNDVKRRYAWIDLLKPETQAAVGVLAVLEPSLASRITRALPVIGERLRGGSDYSGRLSDDGFGAPASARGVPADQLLGPNLAAGLQTGAAGTDAGAMLLAAEQNYQSRAAAARAGDATLGTPQLVWDRLTGWVTGVGKDEALRRALLDWLANDKTFDLDDRDFTFKEITASVGADIAITITGHTHLERAIDMGGSRFYFNCGTWIRLMRFTDAMLKDTAAFKPVYEMLVDGRMSTIDAATFHGEPLVLNQTSAVCVKTESAGVVGELAHVEGRDPVVRKVVRRFVRA
ncbi:MAG: metallophosphoesterase [Candidatus Rokuibacteriota bacterium]